jgi:hypothetical protein
MTLNSASVIGESDLMLQKKKVIIGDDGIFSIYESTKIRPQEEIKNNEFDDPCYGKPKGFFYY